MIISFLAAMDRNLVIGDEKGIPWHLPADLKRFRKLTLGKPIVMGRTTFEHIGRPLDKRTNIVMTRKTDYQPEGVLVAHSVEEAIRLAGDVEELVIVGGGEVYRAFLQLANRLYITFVVGEFKGTAHFPCKFPTPCGFAWEVKHRESNAPDEKNPHAHQYIVVERREKSESTGGDFNIPNLI
nr:Dihydrofolate reductase [uncultured bacterium]